MTYDLEAQAGLPIQAETWEQQDASRRAFYRDEIWELQMFEMSQLHEVASEGGLDGTEHREYLRMVATAEQAAPLARKLGIQEPPVPPDDDGAYSPKALEGERQVEGLLREAGQLPGRDYVRGLSVDQELSPVGFAWPERRPKQIGPGALSSRAGGGAC